MDWIRIPFPISLVNDPDSNPPKEGFESDFYKGLECLPEEVNSNTTHNTFESEFL